VTYVHTRPSPVSLDREKEREFVGTMAAYALTEGEMSSGVSTDPLKQCLKRRLSSGVVYSGGKSSCSANL